VRATVDRWHGTDRFAERRCCESDRCQKRKLLPQHFRFVVAHRAFDSGCAQLPCDFVATRSQLDADEGRLLAYTRVRATLRLNADRSGDNELVAAAQPRDVVDRDTIGATAAG